MSNLSELSDLNGSAAARMIRQVFPQHEWQKIETAPKDGTDILGWASGACRVVRWDDGSYSEEGWRANIHSFVQLPVTHWMPLPEPPK